MPCIGIYEPGAGACRISSASIEDHASTLCSGNSLDILREYIPAEDVKAESRGRRDHGCRGIHRG
jgi:hypothetical protein